MNYHKAYVILNEQYSLFPEQRKILDQKFGPDNWKIHPVPIDGWTLEEIEALAWGMQGFVIIFASPVPALLRKLVKQNPRFIWVFHNDQRKVKKLSNGKLIYTIPTIGWQLV